MYLQGVSTRKVAAITEGLSRVRIGKDAVSRVAQRLEEELSAWRGRPLELAYPYLYLDAAYFKVNWGGRVVDLALLVAVGVNAEGYREVLVVEPAGGERKEAWRNLLKGLVERGLRGVRLVISDDHPSIRQAVMAELPGASWQRCVVHFTRNVLAHVPQSERGVVAEELQEVFVARRRGTAESLARGFVERYRDRYRRAVEVFAQGLAAFPSGKHGEEALIPFFAVYFAHDRSQPPDPERAVAEGQEGQGPDREGPFPGRLPRQAGAYRQGDRQDHPQHPPLGPGNGAALQPGRPRSPEGQAASEPGTKAQAHPRGEDEGPGGPAGPSSRRGPVDGPQAQGLGGAGAGEAALPLPHLPASARDGVRLAGAPPPSPEGGRGGAGGL
jgi:hypothetical protein